MLSSILLTEDRKHAAGWRYGLAVLACGVVVAGLLPFRTQLDLPNTVMFFLLTVVVVALMAGRGPAVLASVLGVALFDFLFVPPRFSFEVSHAPHLLTFAVMLVVSLIVGQLTAGLRAQASEAARRERVARGLYGLARELAGAVGVEQVDESVARFLQEQWNAPCRLLLPTDAHLQAVHERGGLVPALDVALLLKARDAQRPLQVPAGDGTGRQLHVLPLLGATRNRGVLAVALAESADDIGPLLEALAALVSTAVERLHFVEVAQAAQLEAVSERLRSSILSAFSHDVRTPLTALYGLADSLVVGMGIGLAICRSIVEAHGGAIRAFNLPEGGGCVAFCLPRGTPPLIESEALPLEDELE